MSSCPIPRRIESRAWALARETGYPAVSAELFLVALAELPEGTPARDVLASLGLDDERLMRETEAHWRAGPDYRPDGGHRLGYPPRVHGILGMATGLAASLGEGQVTPEHPFSSPWSGKRIPERTGSFGAWEAAARTSSRGSVRGV